MVDRLAVSLSRSPQEARRSAAGLAIGNFAAADRSCGAYTTLSGSIVRTGLSPARSAVDALRARISSGDVSTRAGRRFAEGGGALASGRRFSCYRAFVEAGRGGGAQVRDVVERPYAFCHGILTQHRSRYFLVVPDAAPSASKSSMNIR